MKIVLGISSGIAAYKIKDLIVKLKDDGHQIEAILTKNASKMISPDEIGKLIGRRIYVDLFEKSISVKSILKTRKIDHIEVVKDADIFIVVPTTANTLAKLANGLADDFLTTSLLANISPVLICPSMNTNMWFQPATQKNIKTVESWGYEVLNPASGSLACGTDGIGRLPEISQIYEKINQILKRSKSLKGKKILVTAGGTSEPIDDARIITNRSSGKMGNAIAEMAYRLGADVTYLHAKNAVGTHLPIKKSTFASSDELSDLLAEKLNGCDIVFHSAAVSDFTVEKFDGKIDSTKPIILELTPTQKIIDRIKGWNPSVKLIAFKAVSGSTIPNLTSFFSKTKADFVVVNDISRSDIGFESDENEVQIVSKDLKVKKIEKTSKIKIAEKIIDYISTHI